MPIIRMDDYKKRKSAKSAFGSQGKLREDVAAKEEQAFDLCVYISDERASALCDPAKIEGYWKEIEALQLPEEHAFFYVKAFEAFCAGDETGFVEQFDKFLESEKRIFTTLRDCDWWIDCFMWVFTPPAPGMYGRVAQLLHKHWPRCALSLTLEALDVSEEDDENFELELDLLLEATRIDSECYLAYYLIATIYMDMGLAKSALFYFAGAAGSAMYGNDAAFYFDYGFAAAKAGDYELSAKLYASCLALDETFPYATNNLGCAYLSLGKVDEAKSCFTKAARLGLDGTLPSRNILAALQAQGDEKELREYMMQQLKQGKLSARMQLELSTLRATSGDVHFDERKGRAPERSQKALMEQEIERSVALGELFGMKVRIYEDDNGYGRVYNLGNAGRADFVLSAEDRLLIVMVAECASELDVLRLYAQMDALKKRQKDPWKRVEGIIVCRSRAGALPQMLEAMPAPVRIYRMKVIMEELP